MRAATLSILFLVCMQGVVLASNLQTGADSFSAPQQHKHPKKLAYSKGKGVFGLITGLVLGPVGYAAVCIFSHNRTTREKALLGLEIWIDIVVITACICLIACSKGSTGSVSNINFPSFGTADPDKHKDK
jgi:hypothetical protein